MDKNILLLTMIVRRLASLKNNKGKVFVVGGLAMEGRSTHDIDIVVKEEADISLVKKALGPYARDAHFSLLKGDRPISKIYLTVDKKEGGNLGRRGMF